MENLNIDDIFPQNDLSQNSNLWDSNIFSFVGDKSFKQFNENEKDDDNKSNFTFDSELEKQVGLLTEEKEDDDLLNEAKLNSDNDDSNWSSLSVLKLSNNQHNMTTPINKMVYNNESEDKSSTNMNITENNTLKNIPSSSIFNCIKSDKAILNNLNSNIDIRKFSSSSLYNDKTTQDNHTKTNSINNITNMTNNTNFNNGFGIWNLKNGPNINSNNMKFNNKNYGVNQSYDFHYNSLEFFNNMKYFNYPSRINNINNTQIFSNYNPKNNNNFSQININNELKLNQPEKNFNYMKNNYISNSNNPNTLYFNNFNKSQLSLNSLNNTNNQNTSSKLKNQYKKSNKNIQKNIYQEKIKNYNEKLISMIKSQNGSKSIQKKIEEKSNDFASKLYEQIKYNLFEIINDQYGNYVIQKLVDHCDKKIISSMLRKLSYSQNVENNYFTKNNLYEISINRYGTRALQKMLDNLSSSMSEEDINIILKFCKGNVYSMIKDINGNYVIQSIIENISNKNYLSAIYKEMTENIVNILKTKSGSCCVFPIVIDNINYEDLNLMINTIIDNIEKLINDENGNFSIQKIITKLNENVYNNKIFNYIQDKILKLSVQKFSSNVIETFLISIPIYKDKIISKLIESNAIINLLSDKYGNYIIQKALSYANIDDFNIMMKYIKNNIKILKQTSHGKKIYDKLIKNYKQYLLDDDNSENTSASINQSQNSGKNINEKKK